MQKSKGRKNYYHVNNEKRAQKAKSAKNSNFAENSKNANNVRIA